MVLLFGGIPGGPELLVILLVFVLLLGVPLAVLLLAGALGFSVSRSRDEHRDAADRGRVDELERELAETRAELEELREERERGREESSGGRGDADRDRP